MQAAPALIGSSKRKYYRVVMDISIAPQSSYVGGKMHQLTDRNTKLSLCGMAFSNWVVSMKLSLQMKCLTVAYQLVLLIFVIHIEAFRM